MFHKEEDDVNMKTPLLSISDGSHPWPHPSGADAFDIRTNLMQLVPRKAQDIIAYISMCTWNGAIILFIYATLRAGDVVMKSAAPHERFNPHSACSYFNWMAFWAGVVGVIGLVYLIRRIRKTVLARVDSEHWLFAICLIMTASILGGVAIPLVFWGIGAAIAAITGVAAITSITLAAGGLIMAGFALGYMIIQVTISTVNKEKRNQNGLIKNRKNIACVAIIVVSVIALLIWAILLARVVGLSLDMTRTIIPPTDEQWKTITTNYAQAKAARENELQTAYNTSKTAAETKIADTNKLLSEKHDLLAKTQTELSNAVTDEAKAALNTKIANLNAEITKHTDTINQQNALIKSLGPDYPATINKLSTTLRNADSAVVDKTSAWTAATDELKAATDATRPALQSKADQLEKALDECKKLAAEAKANHTSATIAYDKLVHHDSLALQKR
ncbi:hypothetical protein NEHOM01_2449, partial [Nematocida homosporus]|uniref:uncharacterized protein n=1 Tax=Nematocida homosporus TaxID=1912981 RepID=UPI00221FC047